jgi:type IV pilus assembly protein PilV
MQLRKYGAGTTGDAGFTLIELLVTLVIVSVGMLGLVKLQAAAMAETSTSRTRSIMAYQAESLAGAMRANSAYWAASAAAAPNVTIPAGSSPATDNASTLGTAPAGGCTATACAPAQLARWDIDQWKSNFSSQFPSATGTVVCGSSTGPNSCDITLNWGEHSVAINRTTAAAGSTRTGTGTLVVHVQP